MKRALLVACALAACGGDAGDAAVLDPALHARRTGGTLGVPVPATTLLGLFTVPVQINGRAGPPFLVDTGAPLTFVTPSAWAGVARGPITLGAIEIGAAALFDVPAVGDDPFGLGAGVGGVLGVNVICQFPATWDWQRRRFTLGPPPDDAEVEPTLEPLSFRLRGGGVLESAGRRVAVPPTRLLVEAEVEGARRTLVLDTGASTTALRDDLVNALTADRSSVAVRVAVQGGAVTQRVLRVRELRALGVARAGVPVVGYARDGLANVSREVGAEIDGLLGADFLQEHLVTIDYPAGRVTLRRYRDRAHVRDRWVRVGVLLGRASGRWVIAEVLPGTAAAAAGVPTGAELTAVDGVALAALGLDEADARLQGRAGEVRTLRTASGDYAVAVEDVIMLR